MLFKIYGERNSGTNFLTRLLKANFGDEYVFEDHLDLNTSICYYWKHGYPDESLNKIDTNVTNIFILRDLKKWLVSMYHNPYCLSSAKKNKCFESFVTKKNCVEDNSSISIKNTSFLKVLYKWIYSLTLNYTSTSNISNIKLRCLLNNMIKYDRLRYPFPTKYLRDHKFKKYLNLSDDSNNLFEIRYNKLISYINYGESYNSIYILLDDIQVEEKCLYFLNKLSFDFNLDRKELDLIKRNLKTYSLSRNTKYSLNIDLYGDLINKHQNRDLEDQFRNLSYLK